MPKKTKYASHIRAEHYNFVPGNALKLDWNKLQEMYDDNLGSNPCYLVALDMRQIAFIISHISRFPKFHWTWGFPRRSRWTDDHRYQWAQIVDFVNETEACLLMGCNLEDLISTLEAGFNSIGAALALPNEGGDYSGIIAAIEAIQAQTNVNVESSCGCGCGGGTQIPSEAGDENSLPPDGWDQPTDESGNPIGPGDPDYSVRKCKVANYIQDQFRGYFAALDAYNVDGMSALSLAFLMAGLAELATPFPLIDGFIGLVVGLLAALAVTIIKNSIDFGGLVTLMDNNREDLVCALYNSSSSSSALAAYQDVLTSAGATTAQITFVNAIYAAEALNYLYFGGRADVEQAIESYNPSFDCTVCEPATVDVVCYAEGFGTGLGGWAIDPAYATTGSWTLNHLSGQQKLDLDLDVSGGGSTRLRINFAEPYQEIGWDNRITATWKSGNSLDVVRFTVFDENEATIHSVTQSGFGDDTTLTVDEAIPHAQRGRMAAGMFIEISRSTGNIGFTLSDVAITCCETITKMGTRTGFNMFESEVNNEPDGARTYVIIRFADGCGDTVTINSITGYVPPVTVDPPVDHLFRASSGTGSFDCVSWDLLCANSGAFPTPMSGVKEISLKSDQHFTLTIDWELEPPA